MSDSTRDEIARLQEEYEKNPEGRLFVHLAEAYRRAGELERARGILNEGLERHPDYLSARIVLAQVETELGDTNRALEVWRDVERLDPDSEPALWALAELEYISGNGRSSLGFYRRLAELGVEGAELDDMIAVLESGQVAEPAEADATIDEALQAEEEALAAAATGDHEPNAPLAGEHDAVEEDNAGGGRTTVAAAAADAADTGFGMSAGSLVRNDPGVPAVPIVPSAPNSPDRSRIRGTAGTVAHTDAIGLSDLLVSLLEYRDDTFYAESSLTRVLATAMGRELDLDPVHVEALAYAALLSDLGGRGLGSRNGEGLAQVNAEREARLAEQRDVALSLQLLHGIMLPAGVHEAIRHQHERWDGRGYPDGLKEEEIPYGARVVAIARACAALLTRHSANGGASAALEEIQHHAGSLYDPLVISVLRRVFKRRAEHGIGYGLGSRVMIAHPDELRALDVATQLRSEGYIVEVARDAAGAGASVRRTIPQAIVLGAALPTDDLVRFIREIRASNMAAATPLLILDANNVEGRVDLLTAGADTCFATDISFREFKATLDALLRRREELDRPRERIRSQAHF